MTREVAMDVSGKAPDRLVGALSKHNQAMNRATSNTQHLDHFRAAFIPHSKSDGVTNCWDAWSMCCTDYEVTLRLALSGELVMCGRKPLTLKFTATHTVQFLFETVADRLDLPVDMMFLMYRVRRPKPRRKSQEIRDRAEASTSTELDINEARLWPRGRMERPAAITRTALCGFFFTDYEPVIEVLKHSR